MTSNSSTWNFVNLLFNINVLTCVSFNINQVTTKPETQGIGKEQDRIRHAHNNANKVSIMLLCFDWFRNVRHKGRLEFTFAL